MQISAGEPVRPRILKFADLRLYTYVSLFVVLDVTIPWLYHIIHPLARPMFFFVLLAGILFGWRAGVLVGLPTPIISYGIALQLIFLPLIILLLEKLWPKH